MPRKIRRDAMERKVIPVPFAIRSMTGLPAQIMRLRDRGFIREGYWADRGQHTKALPGTVISPGR